jgi:hypothetical protein
MEAGRCRVAKMSQSFFRPELSQQTFSTGDENIHGGKNVASLNATFKLSKLALIMLLLLRLGTCLDKVT